MNKMLRRALLAMGQLLAVCLIAMAFTAIANAQAGDATVSAPGSNPDAAAGLNEDPKKSAGDANPPQCLGCQANQDHKQLQTYHCVNAESNGAIETTCAPKDLVLNKGARPGNNTADPYTK